MVGNWALGQGPWALAHGPFRRPTVVRTAVRPPEGPRPMGPGPDVFLEDTMYLYVQEGTMYLYFQEDAMYLYFQEDTMYF